jgi:hypothetical protein
MSLLGGKDIGHYQAETYCFFLCQPDTNTQGDLGSQELLMKGPDFLETA